MELESGLAEAAWGAWQGPTPLGAAPHLVLVLGTSEADRRAVSTDLGSRSSASTVIQSVLPWSCVLLSAPFPPPEPVGGQPAASRAALDGSGLYQGTPRGASRPWARMGSNTKKAAITRGCMDD